MGKRLLLLAIFCLAFVLRFYNLSSIPPSLSHDEVAIGYNAYSILKTGKDEYGRKFPLLFTSFDDFKLPGMVYITSISEAVFGLNEFSVRLPSALAGFLGVVVFYFLVKELSEENLKQSQDQQVTSGSNLLQVDGWKLGISETAAFFLAISPWHVNFSRQSFESNAALFFLLLGTYFLLRFTKNSRNLFLSAIFYAISIYFYYSVRLVLPFILLAFILSFRRQVVKNIRIVLLSFLLGLVLVLPILPYFFSSGGFSRINMVSVINDRLYQEKKDTYTKFIASNNDVIRRLAYNRRFSLFETAIQNYLRNFSPEYIFINGTGPMGLLYIIEAPFFFLGIYWLFALKNSFKWIFIVWFFTANLAGGLTTDQPNALRTLLNAPIFSLFSAFGFLGVMGALKGRIRKIFLYASGFLLAVFFVRFIFLYFDYYPRVNSLHFGDGYKQMVSYISRNEAGYDKIFISGKYWRPYIFVLFYKKYSPFLYQEEGTRNGFSKYYFGKADWDVGGESFNSSKFSNAQKDKALFILSPEEYELNKEKLVEIASIDGVFAKRVFVAAGLK